MDIKVLPQLGAAAEREATIYRSRRTLAPDVILFDYSPPITIIYSHRFLSAVLIFVLR